MESTNQVLQSLGLDSKGFKQLLDSQSLVDCTLACDGGKISAHKVVLSACSSYLAKILMDHPVEHPIIILAELNIEDVRTLIHYMYTGELLKTNTLHSASLLKTAAILSVNSLNDFLNGTTASQLGQDQVGHQHHYFGHLPPALAATASLGGNLTTAANNALTTSANNLNLSLNLNGYTGQTPPTNPNVINVAGLATTTTTTAATAGTTTTTTTTTIGAGNQQHHGGGHNGSKSSEFQFKCPVCHNDFQTICSFEYHMQRVHKVTSFGCEICHKPFASLRYVLTDHMRRCHGWKAEQKLQC